MSIWGSSMSRTRVALWGCVGLVLGLAFSFRIVAAITPPRDAYEILRTETGLGDMAIVFGSPIAFLIFPFVAGPSRSSVETGYDRTLIVAFVGAIALNWALWVAFWSIVTSKVASRLRARHHRGPAA